MTAAWQCSTCNAPGFRNVGSRGYCLAHWSALVETFSPTAIPATGLLLAVGPAHDSGFAPCRCARCSATCTAAPATPCPWCGDGLALRDEHQGQLVLRPPEFDPDDARFEPAMLAWRDRLRRGVDAELITKATAQRAWDRARSEAVSHVAVA